MCLSAPRSGRDDSRPYRGEFLPPSYLVSETPLESLSAFDSYATANSLICLIANAVLHQRLAEGRERIGIISDHYHELDELESHIMSVDWNATPS